MLTRRHSYDLFSASVDKRIPTADKPVGERKFNGEPSWCYPTGPAGIWTGLECGSGVRYAGTSSRDGHRRDRRFQHRKRRAHQRRRRRRYRRASRHYQWDSCAVHGRRMRTGASAELQPPGAKVNSSLNRAPRRQPVTAQRHLPDGDADTVLRAASGVQAGARSPEYQLVFPVGRTRTPKNRRYLSGLSRIRGRVTAGQGDTAWLDADASNFWTELASLF